MNRNQIHPQSRRTIDHLASLSEASPNGIVYIVNATWLGDETIIADMNYNIIRTHSLPLALERMAETAADGEHVNITLRAFDYARLKHSGIIRRA